ncbi:TonB C-terminal domain-containing protein [bacterium]|nr:TonB C-terminal domain-containing protein [bacterium]
MTIGGSHLPSSWRSSFLLALMGHVAFTILVVLLPSLGLLTPKEAAPEIMMVRLRGGGENVPGWVKSTPAKADDALVPDNKPQAKEKPAPPVEKKVETPPPVKKEEPKPVHQEPETVAKTEVPVEDPEPAPVQPAAGESTAEAETEETGAGVGAKPGPEGPGIGANSDADFPGANLFLSRVETEVQRRFNYRGRSTGSVAEYHFFIEKDGTMKELILMKSSGIGSMDLAARSALMRAKFPPLPPGFPSDRLGVTYKFHDDK